MRIDREDMLELTRRMTTQRSCFSRIAGAYMDEEGFVDGSFNTLFLKLKKPEQEKMLRIAKTIPYSKTNEQIINRTFKEDSKKEISMRQILEVLKDCELKNDAMLYNLYEYIGENYKAKGPYAIYFFYGNYDIPRKGADHASQWESEEVYQFLIGAICPLIDEYEAGTPEIGFLYPAFANRSTDIGSMNLYEIEGNSNLVEELFFGN